MEEVWRIHQTHSKRLVINMRLLSILGDTPLIIPKSLQETAIENIRAGIPLSEAEADLVIGRLSESDPFSNHSTDLLSDEDLQSLGLTREGLDQASFNHEPRSQPVADPFNLDADTHDEQPGVTVGAAPNDLGIGSHIPDQEIPETVISMNNMDLSGGEEIPGIPGYQTPERRTNRASTPPEASPDAVNPDHEEDTMHRPFPRRKPVDESAPPRRLRQPAPKSLIPTGVEPLMEGLEGMKRLQQKKNGGIRNNFSPESVVASLGLTDM